ncbi:hypothetical protein ACWELJ_30955 [Nocardia sp. NPDC004582]
MTTAQTLAPVVSAEDLERRTPPPAGLRPWIAEIAHIPTVDPGQVAFSHLPMAATSIVLRREASGRRDAWVVGPRTRATYAHPERPATSSTPSRWPPATAS